MKALTLTLTLVLLAFSPAAGFGKNKVQYQYMEWNYHKNEHFLLYYHQDQGPLPETAYFWLSDIYADLSFRFRYAHESPVPIVLYESPALFEQTNIITELLPEEVGGFTEIFKTRIAVPFNGSFADLRHVLHHEMVHAFVFGAIYGGNIFGAASANVPLWFNEGLAEVLSAGWTRDADMYMLDRLLHSYVPPPGPMLDGYLAYKGGQSFLYYLYSTGGDSLFNDMLQEFKKTKSAEKSIETAYEKTLEELGANWLNELRRIYWPEVGKRMEPAEHANAITVNTKDRSRINARPKISPDGKSIAFFSDKRDYMSIIITDTAGKEQRRISGRHTPGRSFESFQAMNGAMCWSPDGSELAFVAKKGGRNEIRIVNIKTGRPRKAIKLPLSAITGLDWSKDGARLALTAISEGRTDIYMYNLNTLEFKLLTDSPETKSSPRFSPDGTKILFTTTDTIGLGAGPFPLVRDSAMIRQSRPAPKSTSNIAVFDIENDSIYLLTNTKWNDKQATLSPDGKSFIFVSDRNGIDNLYLASISAPNNPRPLTDYTGSCGNPDWSAGGSAIVFDKFSKQAWNIWRMESPQDKILADSTLELTPWAKFEDGVIDEFFRKKSVKKAVDSSGTGDVGSINDTASVSGGVKVSFSDTLPHSMPYRLRFTPDYAVLGLGVSTYSGISGQGMVTFSDIMGDHRIGIAGDLQLDFTDYAQIYATYEYLKLRFNLLVGGFYYKYYSYDGHFHRYYHDLETGGFTGLSYPLSMFSRLDAQLFGRHMLRTPLTDVESGVLDNNALLTIFGYSFDNILWGITGPLNGIRGRARLHVAPPLPFTSEASLSGAIAVRHYPHIAKPLVWANRVTLGATAGLDGNRAARRFFLGGDNNWFNYYVNYENYDDNLPYSYYSDLVTPLRGYDYFTVTGDRMMLLNTELRFPFIREISTVLPIPMRIRYINGAVFLDAGYAWDREDQNNFLPIPPKLLAGYGFGMRANLGIFVLRYDRGWPTDFWRTGRATDYFSFGAEF
jgi:Tol biopolymer transport system component